MSSLRVVRLGDNPNEESAAQTQTVITARRVAAFSTPSCDQDKFSRYVLIENGKKCA